MINQEFKAMGRKFQVLPNFGICCRELGGLKIRVLRMRAQLSALSSRAAKNILPSCDSMA